ncbi:BTAD domain-containing putative transcriptional regulator [Streptomyces sp. HSG2]|uniref:BTAD domain-containing putative transcriptional regulator n=1 Tax=Streptomyces sp. HSG2 TaxID=2797167 RepID=UPI0019046EFC|nr:BTAD domain-containing putative transcriptional regulator [Streptomyces sp. HSG2]
MRFQLLGLLSIADGEDTAVLQPSKPTNLLAALLVHSGTVVSTDYLVRAVWDSEPPVTAKAALQSCVLRLRRIFAKYGIASDTIESVPGGYRMRTDDTTSDLARFRRLVRAAVSAADAGGETSLLREALALWKGPVLANVSSRMLHRDAVPRLVEERLRALERLGDIELAQGRCHEVLDIVWDAARSHPERERFSEQLIEALYRTGRQTEALAEIRGVKERLNDDLGIDPGAPLRRLELVILRGEELGGAPVGRPPAIGTARAPKALPPPRASSGRADAPADRVAKSEAVPASPGGSRRAPTAGGMSPITPVPCFAGRSAQLDALSEELGAPSSPGPVVVSGAPGIGKTALATQAAHLARDAFPAGCLTLAMTGPDGRPTDVGESSGRLPERCRPGRRLLLLDDAVSPEQVRPLVGVDADTVTLVTSRRGLAGLVATHGGVVHRLDTLTPEESRRLLVATVGAERIAAEPAAAREIARVCGHFPLALRIVAARLLTRPGLGLGDCAAWLAADPARLSLPDDPRMSVPAVFDAALARLDPDLREAFRSLACAPAGGAPPPGLSDEVLERLADAGFVEDGPPGPYRVHDLLRAHARRRSIPP